MTYEVRTPFNTALIILALYVFVFVVVVFALDFILPGRAEESHSLDRLEDVAVECVLDTGVLGTPSEELRIGLDRHFDGMDAVETLGLLRELGCIDGNEGGGDVP